MPPSYTFTMVSTVNHPASLGENGEQPWHRPSSAGMLASENSNVNLVSVYCTTERPMAMTVFNSALAHVWWSSSPGGKLPICRPRMLPLQCNM
jgi:hypothetical protein